jgi:hypothetical protein
VRAIVRRRLRGAEIAARALGRLSPADALALVLLIREQAPHRPEERRPDAFRCSSMRPGQ